MIVHAIKDQLNTLPPCDDTHSKQRAKDPIPKCPLFGGSTVNQLHCRKNFASNYSLALLQKNYYGYIAEDQVAEELHVCLELLYKSTIHPIYPCAACDMNLRSSLVSVALPLISVVN